MFCDSYPITAAEELGAGVFSLRVRAPQIAAAAQPGQFVQVGVPGFSLRRPISLGGIDPEKGEIRLVIADRGAGTHALSALREGDEMDLLGPLGTGFALLGPGAHVALVGGGIGTPPLLPLAERYGDTCNAILGYRGREQVLLDVDFARFCDTVVCTDDGSYGVRGTVSPALEALLQACRIDIVYACGPSPMLRAVRDLCAQYGVRAQLSLEERMACGVGACLGCAVMIEHDGVREVRRVCKDGPVFEAADIVF